MDFEWSYWIEWGKERILWLLAGHLLVSQVSRLLEEKVCKGFLHSRGFLWVSVYLGMVNLALRPLAAENPILGGELCEWVCGDVQVRVFVDLSLQPMKTCALL